MIYYGHVDWSTALRYIIPIAIFLFIITVAVIVYFICLRRPRRRSHKQVADPEAPQPGEELPPYSSGPRLDGTASTDNLVPPPSIPPRAHLPRLDRHDDPPAYEPAGAGPTSIPTVPTTVAFTEQVPRKPRPALKSSKNTVILPPTILPNTGRSVPSSTSEGKTFTLDNLFHFDFSTIVTEPPATTRPVIGPPIITPELEARLTRKHQLNERRGHRPSHRDSTPSHRISAMSHFLPLEKLHGYLPVGITSPVKFEFCLDNSDVVKGGIASPPTSPRGISVGGKNRLSDMTVFRSHPGHRIRL